MRISLILIVMMWALSSCNSGTVYQSFVLIENQWSVTEPVNFEVKIEDIDRPFDAFISLRYARDYPYNNVYIRYQVIDEAGNQLTEKLEEVVLFVPKTGKPIGSGLGDVFDLDHVLIKNYSFGKSGTYQFVFSQFMRADSLTGIERLGLILQQSKTIED